MFLVKQLIFFFFKFCSYFSILNVLPREWGSLIFDRIALKCTNMFQVVKITVVSDSSWKNKLLKTALQKENIKLSYKSSGNCWTK